jgi:hypothetical protein
MTNEQAKNLIRDTFESPFDEDKFVRFIKNLLKHYDDTETSSFVYSGSLIFEPFRPYISSFGRIGKYTDGNHFIDILIVKLKKASSLERARSMQRNFVSRYLNGSRGGKLKDAALVAFVSPDDEDWRFSLVKMEYKFKVTDDGKFKVEEDFTPARRWSFLVGKNEKSHTAQSRFVELLANDLQKPTLKQLEEAFDIETVTEEFFYKYRDLFIRTKAELDKIVEANALVKADFEAKGIDTVNFAKKLLGQIVFLYFLQKKGWFGVPRDEDWGNGSKHFLRELFEKKYCNYTNFFDEILEPLFYEALRIDRRHDDDYYSRFNCKIPFLNGGLFDPINNYDWVHTDITLPNTLFSNSNVTKEGDIGDGILDIFDRYNFTVSEDEPLEKEVAIDPELLGKTYEQFNAIRPDNFDEYVTSIGTGKENKFNKAYGVYYTPREIVHFMCRQSLTEYLWTQATKAKLDQTITKRDIEDLIELGELVSEYEATALIKEENIETGKQKSTDYTTLLSEGIRLHAQTIDGWLADIAVCDPAVGSGAFPVGMMAEIVRIRHTLSLYIEDEERTSYTLKRCCIENSLYGVDIDPGACEIAKLRLWLSMVIEEQDIKSIKPLPNLDYKIVCGDSLMRLEKNLFNNEPFLKLEELKPLYFNETNPSQKQKYKEQIDDLIFQITEGHTDFDFEVYFSEVFHRKGGFDIVIGNPPYIKEYTFRNAFNGLRKSPYYQGKMDIWYFFACKGIDLLKKDTGILTFIAQNNWTTSYGASKMRNKVIQDTKILQMIDFGSYMIFKNSNIQTMIIMFKSDTKTDNYTFDYRKLEGKNLHFNDVLDLLNHKQNPKAIYLNPIIQRNIFENKPLTFSSRQIDAILNKISKKSNFKLKENEVAQGIVAPQDYVIKSHLKNIPNFSVRDGIFVLSNKEKEKIPFYEEELRLIKPFYTTKELERYYGKKENKEWVIYTDSKYKNPENIKPYPNIKNHLDRFQEVITSDNKPYGLHRARNEKFFKGEKIIAVRKCLQPVFTYTDFDCYVSAAFYIIKTGRINLKYLTALLNSKLIAFWLKHKGKMQGENYQIDKEPLLALPIKKIPNEQQQLFIDLVDKIIAAKKENPKAYSIALEREIDRLVYQLYDLTDEEITIVENKITTNLPNIV